MQINGIVTLETWVWFQVIRGCPPTRILPIFGTLSESCTAICSSTKSIKQSSEVFYWKTPSKNSSYVIFSAAIAFDLHPLKTLHSGRWNGYAFNSRSKARVHFEDWCVGVSSLRQPGFGLLLLFCLKVFPLFFQQTRRNELRSRNKAATVYQYCHPLPWCIVSITGH